MTRHAPTIGITPDTHTHKGAWRYEITRHYADQVHAAGGTPLILPYQTEAIPAYLDLCDALILSGGDDPDMQPFGQPLHPAAKPVVPERQRFELALLRALDATAHPVLGICLGMQWMALHHGGTLHQHLGDIPACPPHVAAAHDHAEHDVLCEAENPYLPPRLRVYSHHHQSVATPGSMHTLGRSDAATGSLIEALAQPGARFYLGVQWHPERCDDPAAGSDLFRQLVAAAQPVAR